MAQKSRVQREIGKKQVRRIAELKQLQNFNMGLHNPVAPKKPSEFNFEKNDVNSFEYPVALGNTVVEKKSDGFCVHVSINRKCHEKIKIYSSKSNEWDTGCFPEVLKDLLKFPSGYYHGELLGLKPKGTKRFTSLDEFIAIQKRPKTNTKDLTSELIEKYPLKLDVFDALMVEGKTLLSRPLEERRAMLEKVIDETIHANLVKQWKVASKENLQQLFLRTINNGYEGLVAKDPLSLYIPGSRNSDWIKLKEFTTLDLAVLGFYETEESKKAGKLFSAILVGSYNLQTKKFETLAKVGIGAKKDQDALYRKVKNKIKTDKDYKTVVKANNSIAFNPAMSRIKRKIPDKIVKYYPEVDLAIVEIQILDVTYSDNWHSCGFDGNKAYSLRIPTFKQLRKDKTRVKDITTTQQIRDYYHGA